MERNADDALLVHSTSAARPISSRSDSSRIDSSSSGSSSGGGRRPVMQFSEVICEQIEEKSV